MSDQPLSQPSLSAALRQSPVTASWLLLALVCLPVSLQVFQAATPALYALFMVDPYAAAATPFDALQSVLDRGQWWRLVSPVFLHFSVMHFVFNSVLFLILGIGLEKRLGGLGMLAALLGWAITSNLAQLLYAGTALFGGLSGVVTAMFGARLLLGWLRPQDTELRLHPGLIISLFVSLIVFSTGVSQLFGISVANTAHWAGFIAGVLVGGLLHLILPDFPESNGGAPSTT